MMSVIDVDMKERILMTRMKYSVLKEGIKDDKCISPSALVTVKQRDRLLEGVFEGESAAAASWRSTPKWRCPPISFVFGVDGVPPPGGGGPESASRPLSAFW
jgi:hypothetical protein